MLCSSCALTSASWAAFPRLAKVATLAEASHAGVVSHNPLGAISTAACLQIAATAPNIVPHEYPNDGWGVTDERPDSDSFLIGSAQYDGDGFLIINDEPGSG